MFEKHAGAVGAVSMIASTLIAMAATSFSAAVAASEPDRDPGTVPYDLAFEKREFRLNDEASVSPDGTRVAYVVLTPPEVRTQQGRFLPNGTPVNAVGAKVHLSGPDARSGTGSQSICGEQGNQWNPSWSPDGRVLGFYSDAGGSPQLWAYRLATGECSRISDSVVRASVFRGYEAKWSPDGRIAYVPLRPDPPLEVSDTGDDTPVDANEPDPGQAPPLVFYSGTENEATAKTGGAKSGDDRAFMLAHYNATLAAIDMDTGRARTIVDARTEPRPGSLQVSPSGRWISYRSVPYREEEISTVHVMDLAVVSAAGGDSRMIARGLPSSEHSVNYFQLDYRWHPSEDQLFYLQDGRAWVVDFDANGPRAPRQLGADLGTLAPVVLYFSKDGKSLVVGTDPYGEGRDRAPRRLAIIPLDGGKPSRFALPDVDRWQFLDLVRANDDVAWQPDVRYLNVQVRDRGTGEEAVFRIDTTSGASRMLVHGLYQLDHFGSGRDHQQIFAIYENVATPPDLYRFSSDLSNKSRVSVVDPRLGGFKLGTAKVLETRVPLYDGRIENVRTTLLLPAGAKAGDRLPAIVMIYSGSDLSTRATQYGGGMGNTVPNQVFTSRGFAVVMANIVLAPEGEPGYPLQHMVDVLLPQVYAAANAGYIDIERLAISGQSYGGYSTASIVSQTNLFRAGIPVNGTYDLAGFYGGLDEQGNSHWIRWAEKGQGRMGDSPWANPQRYISNSPYYRIDRIRTPLLIVAGNKDTTVPSDEARRLFVGLRRMGRSAQLAIYPGEGHVISEWSIGHATDVARRMVEFLRKHLGKPLTPDAASSGNTP